MKQLIKYLSVFILLSVYQNANAQCDWGIEIKPASIITSTCAKNGGFTVTLTGNDAPGLISVAYSATGPTTVNPNSSSVFIEMSAGTYTVTVTAICPNGGGGETKTTTVVVPGNYVAPSTPTYSVRRNALDCGGDFGRILLSSITGSAKPYKIKMTAKPASYSGPTEFVTSNSQYFINDLTGGNYSFVLEDACNTGTTEAHVNIKELVFANAPIVPGKFYAPNIPSVSPCNVVSVIAPAFANDDWIGYNAGDSPLEYAVSIDGGANSAWFQLTNALRPDITLPSGKTYKDYYNNYNLGKANIRVKNNHTCLLSSFLGRRDFSPDIEVNINKNCSDFSISFSGFGNVIMCYPLNINLKKQGEATSTNYTLEYTDYQVTTGTLAFGTYIATYTTADGHVWTQNITANANSASPYSIRAMTDDGYGLNMYLYKFRIERENKEIIKKGTKIELKASPPGYSYSGIYNSITHYEDMTHNHSVSLGNPLYRFIAGNYTWQVTDDCGVYELDITVTEPDMYKYTLDISNQTRTCNSLTIKPTGTYTYNNATKDANFRIISGPGSFLPTVIPPGDSFVLTTPGEYEIMAQANTSTSGNYQPHERMSKKVVYVNDLVKIDEAVSQGFACVGAADNEGQIVVRATGGSGNYTYNLYASLSDAQNNAGLLSSNATGDFPPTLGLMKNQVYYVKIIDDCGSYTIQAITILNLKDTKVVSANNTNICLGGELRLSALVLPSGTYSWVGPNGFTSSLQNPIRNNMSLLDAGEYIVTITSGYCAVATKDTIMINVLDRPNPPSIASNIEVCHKSTPQPLTATPDTDCSIQWFEADGITSIAGAPSPTTAILGTIEYWVQQTNTLTNCVSDKLKITINVVNTCITAVDDNINVLACGKVSFDPTTNDVFVGGNTNLSITLGTPTKGTVNNSGTNVTYTNTSCVKGKDEFTYTVCKDNNGSCSTAKVYINVMAMPEIVMLQNCSFTPQIGLDLQYRDAVYTWERSVDGTSGWTAIGTADYILNVIDAGYYRVKIKIPDMDEAITIVKQVKVKVTVINNSNWYEIWFE